MVFHFSLLLLPWQKIVCSTQPNTSTLENLCPMLTFSTMFNFRKNRPFVLSTSSFSFSTSSPFFVLCQFNLTFHCQLGSVKFNSLLLLSSPMPSPLTLLPHFLFRFISCYLSNRRHFEDDDDDDDDDRQCKLYSKWLQRMEKQWKQEQERRSRNELCAMSPLCWMFALLNVGYIEILVIKRKRNRGDFEISCNANGTIIFVQRFIQWQWWWCYQCGR